MEKEKGFVYILWFRDQYVGLLLPRWLHSGDKEHMKNICANIFKKLL